MKRILSPVEVTQDNFYHRLDKFLLKAYPEIMRSSIMKLIRKGNVYVNGKRRKAVSYTLCTGDVVEICISNEDIKPLLRSKKPSYTKVKRMALTIIYEDENIFVVDKPGGIPTQPGTKIQFSLLSGLNYLGEKKGFHPYLVHRLDKYTSGVLVVAKNIYTARYLSSQFKNHSVIKEYYTVVIGKTRQKQGKITIPLDDKRAVTYYEVLKESNELSLLRVRITTGRKHQIRRHLAAISCPILGDDLYGDRKQNRALKKKYNFKAYLLHCSSITLDIPQKGEKTFTIKRKFEYIFPETRSSE